MNDSVGLLPPRNWPTLLMFVVTLGLSLTVVPWYGLAHGYAPGAWIAFAALLCVTELSITCGYHRLFSHATYQAHPALKAIFLLFGAMVLPNSALFRSASRRAADRFAAGSKREPYS